MVNHTPSKGAHRLSHVSRLTLLALLSLALPAALGAQAADTVAAESSQDALRLGERMYREGLLPSGEPMRAVVQGDIPVDGTMFSCESCHLRSGVGSIEGTVITLPTNAGWLFQPYRGARMTEIARERLPDHLRREESRPAYTEEGLARALRVGVDPAGRKLEAVMPRYFLDDDDMAVMIHYLENLSAEPSPGVTESTLHFATVISEGVDPEARAAMLLPLEAHVEATNTQTRHQERRATSGPFFKEEKYTAYRRLDLSVWELSGSPDTWRKQLEAHYEAKPVFALLGGITAGPWWPIHEFCEDNQIPALFPITDFPVVSESDWYTLYFSKGWYQEGEAVARYLRGQDDIGPEVSVVQLFHDDPEGRALSRGLRETRRELGQPEVLDRVLDSNEILDKRFWRNLTESHGEAVFVLWLRGQDLANLDTLAESEGWPQLVFMSGPLLGEDIPDLPEAVRSFTFLTYPYSLPGEKPRADLAIRQWLNSKHIPITDERIQSKMYVLGWMLAGTIKMMRHDFYRDYFLDVTDMMRDQYYSVATYPRLSFGPGQRYASKGCYLVQVGPGPEPELIKKAGWVIH